MKYIDAEKLKAKLGEHYRKYQSKYMETRNPYTQGLIDALDLVEQVISSLQQVQPEVDLKKEYAEFVEADPVYSKLVNDVVGRAIARHFAEWGAIHLNARKEE